MTNYAGQTIEGRDRFDDAGSTVADAGDINGDGIQDFLIGARSASAVESNQFYSGAVYVVFGTADGPATLNVGDLDGTNGFRVTPLGGTADTGNGYDALANYYGLGTFADGLGDIDGDGIDDIVVGTRTANYYGYNYNKPNFLYVVFGKDTAAEGDFGASLAVGDLDGTNGFAIEGVNGLVNGVESAGDVNGDGFNDILISQTPTPDFNYSGYYGYYGGPVVTSDVDGATPLEPTDPHVGFVVFGENNLGSSGAVDVNDLDGTNGFGVVGQRSVIDTNYYGEGGFYGFDRGGITSFGDVDGDGFDDIGVEQVTITKTNTSYYDVDGYIQYYQVNTTVEKRAFVIFGQAADGPGSFDPTNSANTNASELFWSALSDTYSYYGFGYYNNGLVGSNTELAGIGDINGDGFDDVAVGLPDVNSYSTDDPTILDGETAIGRVGVFFGGPEGVDSDLDRDTDANGESDGLNQNGAIALGGAGAPELIILKSDDTRDTFGSTISGVGDINNDGVQDFAIGAPYVSSDPSVFVIFGQTSFDGTSSTVIDLDDLTQTEFDATAYKFVLDNDNSFSQFGKSISAVGDVNGDGIDDFVIGAQEADVAGLPYGGSSAGQSFVIFGGLDNLEAADAVDGANDNVINVVNLGVDVDTGILPIEVSVRDAGFFAEAKSEGDSGATVFTFEVQRTGDLSQPVSFDFDVTGFGFNAADGSDFVGGTLPSGNVTFGTGEAVATIEVEVQGDLDIEANEDFSLTISNATTSGPAPVTITADETFGRISNDDFPVRFRANNTSEIEGNADTDDRVLEFTVSRSGNTGVAASVDFSLSAGSADASDFEPGELAQSGTLNFGIGETVKTVAVRIDEDVNIEGNESISLSLSNPQSSALAQIDDSFAFGTVRNDDFPPQIKISANGSTFGTSVFEGNSGLTPVTLTFERLGDTTGTTEVTYELNPLPSPGDFFAADSSDIDGFLPSFGNLVVFEDGDSVKQVTVNIIGDGIIEPRETFEAQITNVQSTNGVSYAIPDADVSVTIINDDGRPPVIPPGVEADVFGDPHIVTLDGLGYDFQAVGEYILVETEPGAVNPFQVQVRFEPLPSSDLVSVTTRMSVEIGGQTVEIDALGPDTLLINGTPPSSSSVALGALDVDGDGTADVFFDGALSEFTLVLNDENEQLMVKDTGGALNICVFLADTADGNAGNVRGLMGDGDSDGTADDLALRDGTVLTQPVEFAELYGTYADSWRLDGTSGKEPLFSNTTTFPAAFPAAVLTIDDLPPDLVAAATAAALAAGLDPAEPEIFESAVLDFALTGDDSFLDGALGLAAEPQARAEPANAPALPATVGVTPVSPTLTEGDSGTQSALFSFYRIGDTSGEVTVNYTVGGSVNATDLAPGTPLSGTVVFEDGDETASISIGVAGDLLTEENENLIVTITGASGPGTVLIGGPTATTVIETDDFAPEAADDSFSTNEDISVSGNVLAANPTDIDDDADGDALTVTTVTDSVGNVRAANGALFILDSGAHLRMNADGTFTYDPFGFTIGNAGSQDTVFDTLDGGDIASETFTYEISDGNGGVDTASVTINVTGINDAPFAVVDGVSLSEDDASASVNVISGSTSPDIDPEGGDLTVTKISLAGSDVDVDPVSGAEITLTNGARLTIDEDGNAEFFTNGAFEALGDQPGQLLQTVVGFTYTVSDPDGLTDQALLEVTVTGVNDAPEASNGSFSTNEDQLLEDVVQFDDVDSTTVTVTLENDVSNGALTLNADGTFTYMPDEDFNGTDTFTYFADDGDKQSGSATVEITVDPLNDAPEFTSSDTFDVAENSTSVGTVVASDVDSPVLTYSISGGADAALFDVDGTTGGVTFKSAPDFEAPGSAAGTNTYELIVDASDGDLSDTATLTINVTDVDEGTGPADEPLKLAGSRNDDVFVGQSQDDRILMRWGDDSATGNDGGDRFIVDRRYYEAGDTHTITDLDFSEGDRVVFRFFDEKRVLKSAADLDFYTDNGFATVNGTGPDGSLDVTFQNLDQNFNSDNDILVGGGKDDIFDGGAGDDAILLRFGDDEATGGTGADTFRFDARYVGTGSEHVVTDLDFSEGDTLELRLFEGGKTVINSQAKLDALDAKDFASVLDTGTGSLLTLTNSSGDSMQITLIDDLLII